MAWIKLHGEIWESWKIPALCSALNIGEAQAVGHVVSLWCFTERNAWRDGDLEKWGELGISRAARWSGAPGLLIKALSEAGFLDGFIVHEWTEHQSQLIYDRERWQKPTTREPLEKRVRPTDQEKIRVDKIREEKIRKETAPAQSSACSALNVAYWVEVIKLPLPGERELVITDCLFPLWKQAYPGVDIMTELAKMRAWLLANPKQQKTEKGMDKFINGWLDRAQNSNGGKHYQSGTPPNASKGCPPVPGKYDDIGIKV